MRSVAMDYVYDIEFYNNFFCANFLSFPDREHRIVFEISDRRDDRRELIEFLKTDGLRLIGFNNLGYDYPVLHILLLEPNINLLSWWHRVQREVFNERKIIWPNDRKVFQIDLFKINHYDNGARSTSLKWLEFTQRWYKVQDLPISPERKIELNQMDDLISYCWNDVEFTHNFAESCWNAIKFRENMSEILDRNVMDYSDVKIGEFLNQKKYEEISGRKYREFKGTKTERDSFKMSDIIPSVISFKTEFMKRFLDDLRTIEFTDDDDSESLRFDITFNKDGFISVERGGITTASGLNDNKRIKDEHNRMNSIITFAKGGLHTIELPRVVQRKEDWVLVEKDVGSMYPRSIIVDGIYPEHLGVEWNQGITNAYNYRIDVLKPKLKEYEYKSPEWQKVEDEQQVYKLAMNGGGFGKLGSDFSWQFDPLAKYRVTMGCELKLLMLIEEFIINGVDIISVNTDGVVIHYHKDKQDVVNRIHKQWEDTTQFLLEDTYYDRIIFSSVNDYIAVIIDPDTKERIKIKYKGDFEIDKEAHKNNSQRIVAIALSDYFTKDVPISDIIGNLGYSFDNQGKQEQVTIYDYCIGRKKTSNCEYLLVDGSRGNPLKDKVIRYYIADKSSNYLLKRYHSGKMYGKMTKLNAGFNVRMFMDYFPASSLPEGRYDINRLYYVNECRKIIEPIERGTRLIENGYCEQLSIF